MSQEHLLSGRYVVDPILFLMGRSLPTRIDAQSSGEVGPVKDIGRHEKNTASEYEEDAAHVPLCPLQEAAPFYHPARDVAYPAGSL